MPAATLYITLMGFVAMHLLEAAQSVPRNVWVEGEVDERVAVSDSDVPVDPEEGPAGHVLHDPHGDESVVAQLAEDFCARGYALLAPGLVSEAVTRDMARSLADAQKNRSWAGMRVWSKPHRDERLETANLPFQYPFGKDFLTALANSIVPAALRRVWLGAQITVGASSAQLNPPGSESLEFHFDGDDPLSAMVRIYPEGQVIGQGDTAILSGCKRHMARRGGEKSRKVVNTLTQDGLLHKCWSAPPAELDRSLDLCSTIDIAKQGDETAWETDAEVLDKASVLSPMPAGSVLIYSHRTFHTGLASVPGGNGRRIWEMNVGADATRLPVIRGAAAERRRTEFDAELAALDATTPKMPTKIMREERIFS